MAQASSDSIQYPPLITITAKEIQSLSDRLFSRGISTISTHSPRERGDLILASRCLRELLYRFERCTGHQLKAIVIAGGV
jgi:hypothetical protein